MSCEFSLATEDPRTDDIRALLRRHLEFANLHSPPEDVHALDVDALAGPAITFCTLREDGVLLAVGALKELDPAHGELKSMHTASGARGRGAGRAMVRHLLAIARERGIVRVSLETGPNEPFAAARALYASEGFAVTERFGDYPGGPNSVFMTLAL